MKGPGTMRLFIGITYGAPAINPLSARSNRFRHALTHPGPLHHRFALSRVTPYWFIACVP